MTVTILVSIAALLLGIVALVLSSMKRFQRYRGGLFAATLLMFAISVGNYLSGRSADISPASLAGDTPAPTQEKVQLPILPVFPESPVPSPTLTSIGVEAPDFEFEGCLLFVSNRSGDFEIYKVQKNVNNLYQLTNSPGLDIDPDWSPAGAQVAFASNREEGIGFQIYIMNSDGSSQSRLGPVQPGDNNHPSWSPDGSQIAFQSKRDTNSNPQDDNFDIYVMNSDGSNIRALTIHGADDSEPSWSPDGGKIAFLSERSGQDEVYLMDPEGANPEQLTELPVLKSGLSWSSDAQDVIFEGSGDLYIVDIETKEVTRLTSTANFNEATPAWAQNDSSVIFSSDRTRNWELYILNINDSGESVLQQITDDPAVDRSPDWSPCNQ